MGRFRKIALISILTMIPFLGCSTLPDTSGPWSLIENDGAREKYIMIQQAAGSLSYKKLYYNIKRLSEIYPNEDVITITRAGIYGDYGQTLSPEEEKRHKEKAVEILEAYVKKDYKSPVNPLRILAMNQYLYHSGQYLRQYKFGKFIVDNKGMGGEVLVAVGASMHALDLDGRKEEYNAQFFAKEAIKSWESMYNLENAQMRQAAYQNVYYVSSLAIAGDCSLAQNLFEKNILTSRRFKEMPRWYKKFNPDQIHSCTLKRQLTSH